MLYVIVAGRDDMRSYAIRIVESYEQAWKQAKALAENNYDKFLVSTGGTSSEFCSFNALAVPDTENCF